MVDNKREKIEKVHLRPPITEKKVNYESGTIFHKTDNKAI